MEQNIISLGFNIAEFTEQQKYIINALAEVYEKSKSLSESTIKPGSMGGWSELTEKVKMQQKAIDELQSANLKYFNTVKEIEAVNAKAVKSTAALSTATKEETKSLEANIQARRRLQNTNAEYLKDQKEDLALLKNKTITQAEYTKRLNESTAKIEFNKNKISELNKEIKSQTATTSQQTDAYGLLNKEYLLAQRNAKNLAVIYGIESAEAKAAAASAAILDAELKAIDKTVGQSQRNVGNYGSAFTSGIGKAWSVVRQLAYALPGIGVAGLLGFAIEPIENFVKWLFRASDAEQRLANQAKYLVDVQAIAAKSSGEQVAKLELLRGIITDVSLKESDRLKAIKAYNELADKSNQINEDQIKDLGQLNGLIQAQIDLIGKRALATAFENKLGEAANKVTEAKLKIDLSDQGREVKRLEDYYKASFNNPKVNNIQVLDQIRRARNELKAERPKDFADLAEAESEFQDYLNIAKGYIDVTNLLKKEKEKKDKKEKTPAEIKESTKEMANAGFEFYKRASEARLEIIDDELKREKITESEKLELVREANDIRLGLINNTLAKELEAENKILAAQKNNLRGAKGSEKNNLIVDIHNTNEEIKKLQDFAFLDRLKAARELKKKENEIYKESEEERLKLMEKAEEAVKNVRKTQQGAIDASEAESIAALDTLLKNKVISEKEYAKEKAKIINDTLILSLESQRQELLGLREVARQRKQDVADIDNAIRKISALIKSAETKGDDGNDDNWRKKVGNYLKQHDEEVKITKAAEQVITSLVDAKYQREIDAIQKIIDLNNQRKETEIANINSSTLSAQEKAAQIITLDKQVAANNDRLAREQRDIRIKQAKFDRDAAILSIVENATIAAFKLPAQSGYVGIAAGVALAAEAAAQIALILAKPLPTYGEGVDFHPGGGAIVGEKKVNGAFQKELVEIPGESSFVTNRPMLINNLPRGSKVTPLTSDQLNRGMHSEMMIYTAAIIASREEKKLDEIKEAIQYGSYMTAQALRKQKATNVNVVINADFYGYINKTVRE